MSERIDAEMSAGRQHKDPLRFDFDLPLVTCCHPLGFSLEIATNSPEVLVAADESWGNFKKRFATPPLQLRLGVLDAKRNKNFQVPEISGQWNLIARIADEHNFVVTNTDEGLSYGWLTRDLISDRAYFRYHFLESSFWLMAVPMYLTPIHGACVNLGGKGVLLCGDSGAGKSSLAYACARSGWSFLSDDSSNLVRRSNGRTVIGNPYQIRFRPSAVDLFPELLNQRVSPRITGKLSIELVTQTIPKIRTISESPVNLIVFLNRRRGPAELVSFSRRKAFAWFEQEICYGSQEVRSEQRASLKRLLGAEVCELRYRDLDQAVARLEMMVNACGTEAVGEPLHAGINLDV